jgi:hypothetical protein
MQWVAPATLTDPRSHVAANPDLEGTLSHVATNPDLVPLTEKTVFHVAANPDPVELPSEVKSTCKYPVDDVYTLLELTEPDSRAICSVELHDDDVQRLMVT